MCLEESATGARVLVLKALKEENSNEGPGGGVPVPEPEQEHTTHIYACTGNRSSG